MNGADVEKAYRMSVKRERDRERGSGQQGTVPPVGGPAHALTSSDARVPRSRVPAAAGCQRYLARPYQPMHSALQPTDTRWSFSTLLAVKLCAPAAA